MTPGRPDCRPRAQPAGNLSVGGYSGPGTVARRRDCSAASSELELEPASLSAGAPDSVAGGTTVTVHTVTV